MLYKFEKIINSVSEIVLVFNTEFNLLWINTAGETFFKIKNQELLNKSCADIMSKIFPGSDCSNIKNVLKEKKKIIKEIKTNEDYYFNIQLSPVIENGEITAVVMIIVDITGQKQNEISSRLSRLRLHFSLESLGAAIWEFDLKQYKISYLSPEWYRLLGYEPYELPPDNDTIYKIVHEYDLKKLEEMIKLYMENKISRIKVLVRHKTSNGDYKKMMVYGKKIENCPNFDNCELISENKLVGLILDPDDLVFDIDDYI